MTSQTAIDTRLRPLEAVKAVRRLMANPDATEEVFVILRAMRGRSGVALFNRFRESPMGARILTERRNLFVTLSDSAALAALPEGSLGRTYHRFMASENLSPKAWWRRPGPRATSPYRGRCRCFATACATCMI